MSFRVWYFIHNVFAHPLLALFPFTSVPIRFHDWTADCMDAANQREIAEENRAKGEGG
jgi:hypothetical protein